MKTHCISCGHQHKEENYPKVCEECGCEAYSNPIPVVVAIIPVIGKGLLVACRNIEPQKGKLALVGGFMNKGESPEEALVREVYEEVRIKVSGLKLLGVESNTPKTNVLIFMETDPVDESSIDMNNFCTEEVYYIHIANGPTQMAFPTHQKYFDLALKKWGTEV